jgi:hypothetical protein
MARPRKYPTMRKEIKRFRDYKELGMDGRLHTFVSGKLLSKMYKSYLNQRQSWLDKGYSMRDVLTKAQFQEAYVDAKKVGNLPKIVVNKEGKEEIVGTIKATANFSRELAKLDRRMTKRRAREIFKKIQEYKANPLSSKKESSTYSEDVDAYDDYEDEYSDVGFSGGGSFYPSSSDATEEEDNFIPQTSEYESYESEFDFSNISSWEDIFKVPNARDFIANIVDAGVMTSEEVHAIY